MTTPGFLANTVTVDTGTGPFRLRAGTLVSDPTLQAAVAAAGGQLAPATDPIVLNAAVTVLKARARGQDEAISDGIMLAALAATAASLKLQNAVVSIAASATIPLLFNGAEVMPRAGTLVGGTLMVEGAAAAGESAVVQVTKNGANITGATVTYSSTSVAKTAIAIPNLAGVSYVIGDEFAYVITYVPGGGPALGTGHAGDHNVTLQGTP